MRFNLDIYNLKSELSKNGYKLHPHQIKGVKWLLKHEKKDKGGLLCDEMGVGKTLQIISMMIARPLKLTLIVCPASLVNQWKREILKFTTLINVLEKKDLSTFNDTLNNVYITSYSSINHYSYKNELYYDRIICDEAHYFRNSKSKTYNNLNLLESNYRWCLSGTPIQNYKSDIITLFKFIRQYGKLNDLIEKHMLRRTLLEVNINLPTIHYSTHFVKIIDTKLDTLIEYNQYMFHLEKILRLKQACVIPSSTIKSIESKYKLNTNITPQLIKLNTIINNITTHNENKVIIFSYFRNEIQYLYTKLKPLLNIGFIDGSVSTEEKHKIVSSKDYNILIIQINAGGTGLNLQHYNKIYFTSPQWNPSLEQQAIARVYRIGQTKEVSVKRFINENSIEEHIVNIQERKKELIQTYLQ
jgi:SNF2 family DNA or RNA helicase